MKVFSRWLVAFALLVGMSIAVQAAGVTDLLDLCTGANQSNCPFQIDSSGNITTKGTLTSTASGTSALTGALRITGITSFVPQVVSGVSSTTVIVPTSSFVQLSSTGGLVTVGQQTNNSGQTFYAGISTTNAVSGQFVLLYSTSSNAVQISTWNASGSNNGVIGSAQYLSSANPKILQFIFDATQSLWREIHN